MKKRNKEFWKEKQLIRLRQKDQEISDAIRNQGLVELEVPVHHGYNAEWVLRADILRRDDAPAYQEALDACKEKVWSRTPEFRFKNQKTKKWEVYKPKTHAINKEKYEALSPTAKKFFIEDTSKDRKYWKYGYSDKSYRCTLSYELVVKITKSFITHRREHNNVLYQMDAENEKRMYQVAKNDNPWGSRSRIPKFFRKFENKQHKLVAQREIVDVTKKYNTGGANNID